MSAPNTDPKKQEKEHKTPLMGMAWSVVWAAVLLIALVIYLTTTGNEPGDETSIGATGEEGVATEQNGESADGSGSEAASGQSGDGAPAEAEAAE